MLSFDIRSLETKAVQVDGSIQPDDPIWEEGDVRPSEPVRVTGRLSSAGEGRFYFTGRIDGGIVLPCRVVPRRSRRRGRRGGTLPSRCDRRGRSGRSGRVPVRSEREDARPPRGGKRDVAVDRSCICSVQGRLQRTVRHMRHQFERKHLQLRANQDRIALGRVAQASKRRTLARQNHFKEQIQWPSRSDAPPKERNARATRTRSRLPS